MRRLASLTAIFAVVILSACLEAAPFVPKIDEVGYDPSLGVDLAASTELPSGLWYRDIAVGTGYVVRSDTSRDTVRIRYRGYLRNAFRFDSNTGPGEQLLTAVVNAHDTSAFRMIDGMDEGLRGMQVGGIRQLIIPPKLGYGGVTRGNIPANSILIFRVEAISIDSAQHP
jgi:FKBP-type peptidyl-prolyl cis-trans isomerase